MPHIFCSCDQNSPALFIFGEYPFAPWFLFCYSWAAPILYMQAGIIMPQVVWTIAFVHPLLSTTVQAALDLENLHCLVSGQYSGFISFWQALRALFTRWSRWKGFIFKFVFIYCYCFSEFSQSPHPITLHYMVLSP